MVDTLRSAWITTGPKTRRFEQEFAAYLGAPGALVADITADWWRARLMHDATAEARLVRPAGLATGDRWQTG